MEDKKEIVNGLYDLRAKLIDKKLSYEDKLSAINSKIKEINSEICDYVGHDYGEWFENLTYGYFRTCNRCNKTEFKNTKAKVLEKK